jgi:hypothetical protein
MAWGDRLRGISAARCRAAFRRETLQIVRIALVFTSCLTARPVDEIGENRSGSACAHAPASRYALASSSFGFPLTMSWPPFWSHRGRHP